MSYRRIKIGISLLVAVSVAALLGIRLKSKGESNLFESAPMHERTTVFSPTAVFSAGITKPTVIEENNAERTSSAKMLDLENPVHASLRDVGDTAKFSGYTIVKIDPKDGKENPEMALIQEDWSGEAAQFLSSRLGLAPEQIEQYSKASAEAFAEYNRKTMAILDSAKKVYGPDIALILEGDLQAEYDRDWKAYDESVKGIMGERGTEEFKGFVERFNSIAFDRVGFVPSFIR